MHRPCPSGVGSLGSRGPAGAPCSQQVFVDQLPAPVTVGAGSSSFVGRLVSVPAGSNQDVDLIGELAICNGTGDVQVVTFDLFDAITGTVIQARTMQFDIDQCESVKIVGGLEQLSPGDHLFVLRANIPVGPFSVSGAALRTEIVTNLDVNP